MPSQLNKVQKKINKKKGPAKKHALHENSRDARRVRRAGNRDDRVAKTFKTKSRQNDRLRTEIFQDTHASRYKSLTAAVQRIFFFQESLIELENKMTDDESTSTELDEPTIRSLIHDWISRDDEELDALKSSRRPGQPATARQTAIEQQIETEQKEYTSGFWMPDLRSVQNIGELKLWAGRWDGLGRTKFVRVPSEGDFEDSAWPPRGAV